MSDELLKTLDLNNEESLNVISKLLDNTNIRLKSDIKTNQLIHILALQIEAETFGIGFYYKLCDLYLEDKVSENRKSREEVVKAYIGSIITKLRQKQDVLGDKL